MPKGALGSVILAMIINKSHEIRTYMTRIMSMADLTLMTEVTEEQRDYLMIIKSSTKSLLSVFNDILDDAKAKMLSDKANSEQMPFDIRRTIQEAIDLFHDTAKQKNVLIKLNDLDHKIPQNLIGDPQSFKQAILYLVGNSVKFTNNGEVTINVDAEKLDERRMQLQFMVSDTGVEIPEDELVKMLELKGGDITVGSKEGTGNKICFTAVFAAQGEGGRNLGNKNSGGRR